jgi:hypothetical protein
LKSGVLPAFRAALAAIKTDVDGAGEGLKLGLVQRAIDECERLNDPALAKVLALMWRFAAEAARVEAASFARHAAGAASAGWLPQIPDFSPVNDDVGEAPMLIADFDWPSTGSAPALEFSARGAELSDDCAPPVELPPELVASLDDAA